MQHHNNDDERDVIQEHDHSTLPPRPIREWSDSSISTTLSALSSASGSEGAPSSRQSSIGHSSMSPSVNLGQVSWNEFQKSPDGNQVLKESGGRALCILGEELGPTCAVAVAPVMPRMEASQDANSCADMPRDLFQIMSDEKHPRPHARSAFFPKYTKYLFLVIGFLLAWRVSPYSILVLVAALCLVILARAFIRTLIINPVIRCIILSYMAWKTSSLPTVYPLVVLILGTIYSIVRPVPIEIHNSLVHNIPKTTYSHIYTPPTSSSATAPRLALSLSLLVGTIKVLAIASITGIASLLLCCAYAIWDHEEPAFLAALFAGLLALSQIIIDISQNIKVYPYVTLEPNLVRGIKEKDGSAFTPDQGAYSITRGDALSYPSSAIRASGSSEDTVSHARPALVEILSSSALVLGYATRGVAACAWLVLWGEIDAHRAVLYVANIHHRLLV